MDRDLLPQQLDKGALYEGATHDFGSLLKKLIKLLDVVAARNAEEFKHGLVILERQHGLVAY